MSSWLSFESPLLDPRRTSILSPECDYAVRWKSSRSGVAGVKQRIQQSRQVWKVSGNQDVARFSRAVDRASTLEGPPAEGRASPKARRARCTRARTPRPSVSRGVFHCARRSRDARRASRQAQPVDRQRPGRPARGAGVRRPPDRPRRRDEPDRGALGSKTASFY